MFKFLKKEGRITDDLIQKLLGWKHSGFSVDSGVRIERGDEKGREAIAQFIMRNVFSTDKITYIKKTVRFCTAQRCRRANIKRTLSSIP